jgi:hypothetical protein
MGTALALFAVLSLPAAEADDLRLTNVRPTHCVLGPARAADKVLPGDSYVVSFDIEGITMDDAGKARYSVGVDVSGVDGKVHFKQEPREQDAQTSLGGGRLPAYAQINVGLEAKPGEYTLKATVTDLATGKSATLTRKAEVLPKEFGMVRLTTSSDPDGRYPVSVSGSGEWLFLHVGVVGFARNGSGKQPDVAVTMRIVDEDGKPTTAKPVTVKVDKDVPETASSIPVRLLLSLNRPGKFTVELTATDRVSNKTATLSFPLAVASPR